MWFVFFFFNDTPTTEIYPLPLHDALPILVDDDAVGRVAARGARAAPAAAPASAAAAHAPGHGRVEQVRGLGREDRKSTRLNSSHSQISYAVFCLKKKNVHNRHPREHTCIK